MAAKSCFFKLYAKAWIKVLLQNITFNQVNNQTIRFITNNYK